jgi:hypothetical protein
MDEHDNRDAREANEAIELSNLRIRQHAALKRAAYRSRSYAIVAAAACIGAVAQLLWLIIGQLRGARSVGRIALYIAFLLAAGFGIRFFIRKAIALHQEAIKSSIAEPTAPPDFSKLNDGSDLIDRLNNVK